MTASRRPAVLVLSAMLAVTGLAACSGGGSATSSGSAASTGSTQSATATGTATATATATAGGSGAATGSATSGPVPSAPATTGSDGGGTPATRTPSARNPDLGYRVTWARTEEKVGATKASSVYPLVTVTGGATPAVRSAAQTLLRNRIATQRRSFVAAANDPDAAVDAQAGQASEQEIDVLREVRWGRLYAVELSDYSYSAGAAHPLTNLFAVTLDWRTGHEVGVGDVFANLAPVDRAVRAALVARDVDEPTANTITVGPGGADTTSVDTALTPQGLWVGVSHCIAVCALGPIEITVPWPALPAPRPGVLP